MITKNNYFSKNKKKINMCTIMTTGRTGSDYLAACLDGLKDVIIFSGKFDHSIFFKKNNKLDKKKLINKFLNVYKNLFKYDEVEQINHNINIKKFKKIFLSLSENKIDRKNFLLNLYYTYNLTLKRSLKSAKIIVHHSHGKKATKEYLKDFPESKILITIRDPRANLKSGIYNWYKFKKEKYKISHILFYLKRIKNDFDYACKLKNKKMFVCLEKMYSSNYKKKICDFLNIKYDKKILVASYGGKIWTGDKLSIKKASKGLFDKKLINNEWKNYFSKDQIKIFNIYFKNYKSFYKINEYTLYERLKLIPKIFSILKIEKEILNKYKLTNYLFHKNLFFIFRRCFFFLLIILKIHN